MSIEVARNLYESGRAHALSCNLLYNSAFQQALDEERADPEAFVLNGSYSLSIYYLVALGLELYLKSALVYFSGLENKKKLLNIGHDLVSALNEAEAVGFQSEAPNEQPPPGGPGL